MDEAVVKAVLEDWQVAPISERLRAALGFLVKLNNTPEELTPEDIEALERQGLDRQAIAEAAYVCFVFNILDRLADAFDFELENETQLKKTGMMLYTMGYKTASLPG